MDREQTLILLVLSVPPALGVTAAIRLSAPSQLFTALAAGAVTFLAIAGLVYLAVAYEPPLPDEDAD